MRIARLGTGSWGTAMAGLVASHGHTVVMWSYDPAPAHEINELHTNSCYLSDYTIMSLLGLLIVWAHRSNVRKLLNVTESKLSFSKRVDKMDE